MGGSCDQSNVGNGSDGHHPYSILFILRHCLLFVADVVGVGVVVAVAVAVARRLDNSNEDSKRTDNNKTDMCN